MVGKSLGPYEIIESLGAGGMGEVYLARDTRLGRKVAVKVLPAEFASDPERLARFEQEARAAAALNHPHIAVVHDIGSETDESGATTQFMVQEYLQGDSLRDLLERGPLPLKRTLALGIEVAGALAVAHKAGIVHRDLKPENLFVVEGGHAKILDFGLAKLTEMAAASGPGGATMSPTVIGTMAGTVMGSAGYMAPEQVHGQTVDGRADLFAFGCVLYEMVTGRRAFAGRSLHETLSQIVHDEPPEAKLAEMPLPGELGRILRKCLSKDLETRYQGAADLAVDLRNFATDLEAGRVAPSSMGADAGWRSPSGVPPWLFAATILVAAGTVVWALAGGNVATPPTARIEFDVPLAAGEVFPSVSGVLMAFSADGQRLVYEARSSDGLRRFYLRELGSAEATAIPGTEGGKSPSFSPDGNWLVFHDDIADLLVKVPLDGGQPIRLAQVNGTVVFSSWGDDGNIVYERARQGLWRVPATGGDPELLLEPTVGINEYDQPHVLPGSRAVLLQEDSEGGAERVVLLDLETRELTPLLENSGSPRYLPPGYLIYTRQSSVFAVRFDLDSRQIIGDPVVVLQGLRIDTNRRSQFAVSPTGALAFIPGDGYESGDSLAWIDRERRAEPLPGSAVRGILHAISLSPDGRRVALQVQGEDSHSILVLDSARQVLTRFDPRQCETPTWSPDGDTIYAACVGDHGADLVARPADFSAPARTLWESEDFIWVGSATPDGNSVLLWSPAQQSSNLMTVAVDGSGEVVTVRESAASDRQPMISPDGRWLAYTSSESDEFEQYTTSGNSQVFVSAFPGPGATVQVSSRGPASSPQWSPDGRVLYWAVSPGTIMMAQFDGREGTPTTSAATAIFEGVVPFVPSGMQFVVSADGSRVLASPRQVGTGDESVNRRIRVVLNWVQELQQQLPLGR